MKKFLVTVLVTFAIIFSCTDNRAEAYDYYLGDYHTGLKAYVMTDSIYFENYFNFQATVKAVNSSGRVVEHITYFFNIGGSAQPATYRNSQGYSGRVFDGNISRKLYEFAMKFSGRW